MFTLEEATKQDRTALNARNWRSRAFNRDVTEILDLNNKVLVKVWRIGDVPASMIADAIIEAMIEKQSREGEAPPTRAAATGQGSSGVNATANAIAYAKEVGVELSEVKGRGKDGRISKEDVVLFLEKGGDS